MPTHVGDNADDGADENGKEMPRLGSDTGRGGDEPDDETCEHGVAKGLELGPLPLSRSGSLHGGNRSRARSDSALGNCTPRGWSRDLALTKLNRGGTIALRKLRGTAGSGRTLAHARGRNGANGGTLRRIRGAGSGRDASRGRGSRHGRHVSREDCEFLDGRVYASRVMLARVQLRPAPRCPASQQIG